LREQRKKIEQEIKSMESKTMGALADERDSVVAEVSAGSRSMSIAKEPSPTRKMSAQHGSPTRKPSGTAKDPSSSELTKERSPSRKAPSRDISPIAKETPAPAKQPSKEVSPARKSPAKDASPARSTATPKDGSPVRGAPQPEQPAGRKEVSPARKEHSTETTRSKATILVEQKQEGRNISVAEITILPVLEVSHEAVRTKTTASRTHEKVLTKQSSDTKFDRRATSVANSRVITNKSSSDFDIKRRVADLAAPDKRRAQPATTASPDKRRAAQPAQQKPNHITVAKIKIESPRKPTAGKPHPAEEPKPTGRQPHRAQAAEPETDPESSKDTGLSDNSEVEETVESVIEMSVTGTACCRHTDRKDSAPVYRTTGAARSGKSYTRSSSDNHLRATSASTHRHQPAVARDGSNVSAASATLKSAAGGRKVERPVKHVATKTINLATKPTAGSDSLDNVVIDIQLAKSSREPTPNKLVPIPVSPDTEDAGKPRYPDAVQEPDDEAAGGRPARNQRVSTIPIFEEATSEYVGCEITEVDEQQEASAAQQATRITNLDRVTEDDESLLSVTEKVNKFAQEARRLQADTNGESQRPPSMGRFAARPEYDDLDDHLKSDECLLSVSDKVTKFISTAEEVKKIRTSGPFVPGTDDGPVKVADGDECLLSVNEKVSRFARRMTRAVDARDDAEEDESDQQQRTAVPGGLGESVPGKFVPQRSPELVKNAMRTTARHLVEEHAPGDELAQSVGSIASRYRTATMAKPYEKAPAGGAPAASPITLRSTEAVKKAKELFEKGQTDGGRQRDILNRPSVWEERRTRAQPAAEPKRADVKLTDIGVTERKAQTEREEHVVGEESAPRKPSITKVEQQRPAEPAEAAKPTGSAGGRRDSSGSGVRPPAYIRDVVSTKKDLFEKRISSSKMQVEYTSQTSQEATETQATATLRKQSLKQAGEAVPSPSTPANRPSADQSKPSYMNHTMLDGLELAGRREAKVVRKGSVKELTERFIHRESSGSLTQDATRTYPKAGLILRSSAQQSQSSRASTPATDGCSVRSGSVDGYDQEEEEAHSMTTMTTRQVRSFLNDTSKVVDVRDVLQRMSNADNVTEQGDSAEDQEARALLNKFLGASVLMSGVESMVSSPGTMLGEASAPSASGGTKKNETTKVNRRNRARRMVDDHHYARAHPASRTRGEAGAVIGSLSRYPTQPAAVAPKQLEFSIVPSLIADRVQAPSVPWVSRPETIRTRATSRTPGVVGNQESERVKGCV
uniref:Smoothelin domain-containing protein n=1 Tax=Anopheles coluzzii TaxID=1518534 RepID=A0A8W7PXY8_ANOCL